MLRESGGPQNLKSLSDPREISELCIDSLFRSQTSRPRTTGVPYSEPYVLDEGGRVLDDGSIDLCKILLRKSWDVGDSV